MLDFPIFSGVFAMLFRLIAALSICLLSSTPQARADLFDQQPSYTRMAAKCGSDPGSTSFSKAEYTKAYADAAKAGKQAAKDGNKARAAAIAQQVAQMKECEKQEAANYKPGPIKGCASFRREFKTFVTWLGKSGITDTQPDRAYELSKQLTPGAKLCMKEILTKCIDPLKTDIVFYAVETIEMASDVDGVSTMKSRDGLDKLAFDKEVGLYRLTFCTETDFACKGDPEECEYRVARIKKAMTRYISK